MPVFFINNISFHPIVVKVRTMNSAYNSRRKVEKMEMNYFGLHFFAQKVGFLFRKRLYHSEQIDRNTFFK